MKPTQQAIENAARAIGGFRRDGWEWLSEHRREYWLERARRALSADLGDMVLMPLPARPETEVKG